MTSARPWVPFLLVLLCSTCYISQAKVTSVEQTVPQHPRHVDGKLVGQARLIKYDGEYGERAALNLSYWRTSLFKRTLQLYSADLQADQNDTSRPNMHRQSLELFKPFMECPPDMPLTRVPGADPKDAAKWMCAMDKQHHKLCVVYSLGSNNDYGFEEHILQTTACSVHTFDCTIQGGRSLGIRHYFHSVCIGTPPAGAPNPAAYKSLTEVREALGHTHVHIMKMDIEGYEYDGLQEWTEHQGLPDQLLLEIHYTLPVREKIKTVDTVAEMSLLFAHLANLGYGIVGMEPNGYGTCCAELGLFRIEMLQPLRSHRAGDRSHMGGGALHAGVDGAGSRKRARAIRALESAR